MKKILFVMLLMLTGTAFAAPVDLTYDDGIYHIVLSGDKMKKQVEFVSSSNLITNKEAHNNADALLTINAGFFDPENQKTAGRRGQIAWDFSQTP